MKTPPCFTRTPPPHISCQISPGSRMLAHWSQYCFWAFAKPLGLQLADGISEVPGSATISLILPCIVTCSLLSEWWQSEFVFKCSCFVNFYKLFHSHVLLIGIFVDFAREWGWGRGVGSGRWWKWSAFLRGDDEKIGPHSLLSTWCLLLIFLCRVKPL